MPWILDEVPPGDRIVVEPAVPGSYRRELRDAGLELYPVDRPFQAYELGPAPGLVDDYRAEGYCWVMVNGHQRDRGLAAGLAGAAAYYRALAAESELVLRASPFAPGATPTDFSYDFSFNYYPPAHRRPGPVIELRRLRGCCQTRQADVHERDHAHSAHPPHSSADLARHPYAVPLLAAVLLALVGAQIALVFKVPSWGNDEPAHTGYVAVARRGPAADHRDRTSSTTRRGSRGRPIEFRGWDEEHGDIWTANHPPLFHLAMVPVWWVASDHQSAMIITMRLANTLGFAVWLFLVGVLARELVPRRPAVTALAVVVAAAPTLVLRSAFFVNDGWASASALLLLLVTIRMMRGAVTPRLVAVAVAAGTVAAGTRAQGVLVVALCALALLVVLARREGWRRGCGRLRRRRRDPGARVRLVLPPQPAACTATSPARTRCWRSSAGPRWRAWTGSTTSRASPSRRWPPRS